MRIFKISAVFSFFLVMVFLVVACNNDGNPSTVNTQKSNQTGDQSDNQIGHQEQWSIIPIPDISNQPILLRVSSVVNPRFKQLSTEQIDKILNRSKQLVQQYFNIAIEYSTVEELLIEDVFNKRNERVIANRKKEIVDIKFIDKDIREAMQQSLFKTLSNYTENKSNVIEYAQPYLLQPEIKHRGFISFSYALADTLIARLNYWQLEIASDGQPVLDANEYNQWVWWDSLGYGDLPYEVVITNQLVASSETYGMDVHSSIRGGITAGTTTYNKNSSLKSYVYIMVYPMLNNTELLTTLRQDESYSDEQIINYAAALLTHEIGHMLLHLGHPFGSKHCIMSPTTMLNYREWYESLDANQCPLGSSPAMTPGSVNLEYNRSW